jgi:hypothetical protein
MAKLDNQDPAREASPNAATNEPVGPSALSDDSPSRLFERILEGGQSRPRWPVGEPFVAECIDPRHPTLQGRVSVRWCWQGGDAEEVWVPTLHGLAIRKGDRLLLQMPHGADEPIVVGVIDGFLPRPGPTRRQGARLELKNDETLQVCDQDGHPLVEVVQNEGGPVVRLLQSNTRLDLNGKLSITAGEIELKAKQGQVRIEASDDVILVGEVVHLN